MPVVDQEARLAQLPRGRRRRQARRQAEAAGGGSGGLQRWQRLKLAMLLRDWVIACELLRDIPPQNAQRGVLNWLHCALTI